MRELGREMEYIDALFVRYWEQNDASVTQQAIREINTGIMACPGKLLGPWLSRLNANNAQGEYYLTDIVACSVADGVPVTAVKADSIDE